MVRKPRSPGSVGLSETRGRQPGDGFAAMIMARGTIDSLGSALGSHRG